MNRRELIAWLGLAVLGAAIVATCAVVFWAALPRERVLSLGPPNTFPADRPQYLALDPHTYIFIVNLRGQLIAWDSQAPVGSSWSRCHFKWVPTNHRFEDPCTGDKWCLDGAVADNRSAPTRTLDRYQLDVDRDGNVWLHPDQTISGTPFTDTVSRFCPGQEQSQ